jgi:hypothetical protein
VLASTVTHKNKLKCFNTICRNLHFNSSFQLCTEQHVQPYLVQLKESGHDVVSFFFPDSKSCWILYPKKINWFVSPVAASTLGSTWKEKSSCAQNEHERNERNEIDCQTTSCMCVPKSKYSWNPGLLQLYTRACSAIFNALTGKKRCLVPAFIKVWSRIWNIWLLLQRIIN